MVVTVMKAGVDRIVVNNKTVRTTATFMDTALTECVLVTKGGKGLLVTQVNVILRTATDMVRVLVMIL